VKEAHKEAGDFYLNHRPNKSDKTGETIHPGFLTLSHYEWWKHNVLRALDHFRQAHWEKDEKMNDALQVLIDKRRSDYRLKLQSKHAGQVLFDMEKGGRPSRWNTLRAMRVMERYYLSGEN
jgi:hypothetical protein